jgi:hypothetical protein
VKLNEDKVPATIDEAIDDIFNALSDVERAQIKKFPPASLHMSLGQVIRNMWSMSELGTPLQLNFKKRFDLFGHPDDVSGIIIEGLLAKLNKKSVKIAMNKASKSYREHWEKVHIDPITGKQI